jgi:Transcriptional regulators
MADSGGARPADGSGRPARPPTMRDVAAAAGVSKALVSMIFRNAPGPSAQSRAHVLEVAERIGYRPNRTASLLARRRSRHLGLTMTLRDAHQAELAEEVQAAADGCGYEIVLSAVTRGRDERRAIETLLEYRCEALLLIGPTSPVSEIAALAEQVPVVVLGRRVRQPGVTSIRADDGAGMGALVAHLAGLGHRRIAHIDAGEGTIAADRRHGYEAAMREHGLGQYIRTIHGGLTEQDGIAAAERLLATGDLPTAIVACSDPCALGVLDRLTRAGIDVPTRVSVTGYDDFPIARAPRVNLTTVGQETRRQARLAVQAAVECLENRNSAGGAETRPRETVLPPRLVIRASTAPPPR